MTGQEQVRGTVVQPGAGLALRGRVVGPLDLMLTGAQTGGAVTALENVVAPGAGPPLHLHVAQDETWRVLAGTVRFRIGDEVTVAGAGAWAYVPRGVAHCYENVGERDAVLAVLFTPAGMERFFVELSRLDPNDVGPDTIATLAAPDGMIVLGPRQFPS